MSHAEWHKNKDSEEDRSVSLLHAFSEELASLKVRRDTCILFIIYYSKRTSGGEDSLGEKIPIDVVLMAIVKIFIQMMNVIGSHGEHARSVLWLE